MTLETMIGPVTVLHRLALGVECLDSLLESLVLTSVRAGWQAGPRLLPRPIDPSWPCLNLEGAEPARFKLRHQPSLTTALTVRIDDPSRRYVPRRVGITLWPPAAVDEARNPLYIPVKSRLLRLWLWPGSAYALPRGTTVVRGRVMRDGEPVRWPRLTAIGPNGQVAGRAHGDDRGEFLLVIIDVGQNPVQSQVGLDVSVHAPKFPTAPDPADRCADLVIEDIPRSGVPAGPADLDNPLLRGISVPLGYAANIHNPVHRTVPVGAEFPLTEDIVFEPQP
jgi:hypothetical protein